MNHVELSSRSLVGRYGASVRVRCWSWRRTRWRGRRIEGELTGSGRVSLFHCRAFETCISFLEVDESSTILQSMRRSPLPFTVIVIMESAWSRKLLSRWRCLGLGSTLLPLAILFSVATVSSISAPILVSVTVVAGSISGVAIARHALRGIAFLEACSDHLRAIDSIESTADRKSVV